MLLLLPLALCLRCSVTQADQSFITLTDPGTEFVPVNSILLVVTLTASSVADCALECHQYISCRTFDMNLNSGQCRIFDADLTTGSVVANSLKPQSYAGVVQLTSDRYLSTHNRPCAACAQSRYEICDSNSATCQCLLNTNWDQGICRTQLFENATCSNADACRADFNLTCVPCYTDVFRVCAQVPALPYGTTAAENCNGTSGSGSMSLQHPHGLLVTDNGTIYVTDTWNARLQVFLPNSRSGVTIMNCSLLSYPEYVTMNSNASTIYVSDFNNHKVFLYPQNLKIPQLNVSAGCSLNQLSGPIGIAVDSHGNVYIADYFCHHVLKWPGPNANTSVRVAGTSVPGNSSTQLNAPCGIYLDESNSVLYVADNGNHRIQKFFLDRNSTAGVTVAGGNGLGPALNQLNSPTSFAVSRKDGSIYVADNANNRIVLWKVNATQGVVIAGSENGTSGSTALLFSSSFDVKFDVNETFLYVSDSLNNRIQRFPMNP